ncbi:MAG: SPASM domain-containing protein, partial [Clostridia bacterium]|nr:SPASM domain-containing protein [Clostridia bacterium]
LQVTFTANKRNVYEFEELYKILNPIGLDSIRVSFMDPIGRALDNMNLLLNREEILYLTGLANKINSNPRNTKIIWGCPHFLNNLLDHRRFLCFTGIYGASILVNGDIFVCPNVPHRPEFIQGNILKDSLSEVWRNGFKYFRNRPLPEKCKDCEYKEKCKGDSVHTMDFDSGEPLFCYRDNLEKPEADRYKDDLFARYPDTKFYEISGDDENACQLIIEPDAYRSIKQYFHMGEKNPLSMFEQQMALIGFENGSTGVVRYVIPCDGAYRAEDNAIFSGKILKTVESELAIINKNYYNSSDKGLCGSECDNKKPMKFLGFIHSHPTQSELQYSTGDDRIHGRMLKKYGSYTGVLVNPADGTIGAYYGAEIKQAKLIIPEV